ncbi:hypothetical protein Tco_1326340 [Tanacetum coccineum]
MAAPTIPVSTEENLRDPIDIRVDIIHPEHVAAVAFPPAVVVRILRWSSSGCGLEFPGQDLRGLQETQGAHDEEEKPSKLVLKPHYHSSNLWYHLVRVSVARFSVLTFSLPILPLLATLFRCDPFWGCYTEDDPYEEDSMEDDELLHAQVTPTPPIQPSPIRPTIRVQPGQEILLRHPFRPLPNGVRMMRTLGKTDHLEDLPLERVEFMKQEIKTLQDRVEAAEKHIEVMRDSLRIARDRITKIASEVCRVHLAGRCTDLMGNSHVKKIRLDDAYEIKWKEMKQVIIDEFYQRNEIQIMGTELWNLSCEQKLLKMVRTKGIWKTTTGQQNKQKEVMRAYTAGPNNKNGNDCPKLKNQNRCNQTGSGGACKRAFFLEEEKPLGTLTLLQVIIGIDWLSKYHAVIICDEKLVCIPYGSKTLSIQEDMRESRLNIISCIKTRKYIKKGCHVFLAQIKKKKSRENSKETRLENVHVVQDFLKVFPEDLLGLRPTRQIKFQIELVPRVALVARAPFRLAPSELQVLSSQLKELADKGFI